MLACSLYVLCDNAFASRQTGEKYLGKASVGLVLQKNGVHIDRC